MARSIHHIIGFNKKREHMNFKQKITGIKAFIFDIDGVLSSTIISVNTEGLQRTIYSKDSYAIQYAIKKGYKIAIITGGKGEHLIKCYQSLGIKDIYINSGIKKGAFHDFLNKHNLTKDEVLYMGDDIPDYEVMSECGVAVCPLDASHEIKSISMYISDKKGGYGCVRDIIEQVLKSQNQWFDTDIAYEW